MPISLKAARVNAKLTKKQVCEALVIHPNTLDNYESYKTKPDIEKAKQLVSLYGCNLDDVKWSDD